MEPEWSHGANHRQHCSTIIGDSVTEWSRLEAMGSLPSLRIRIPGKFGL